MNEDLSIAEMGQRLPGRYRLIRVLSQSPSGVVYLAEEPALTRYVAVTVLAPGTAGGPADRAHLARAVAAATALGHPHILPAYPGESDGLLYLVSPFVDNPDLGARMSTTGPPPVPATMRILRQVADALDVAHRAGLVHRGVRPGAILVDPGFEHAYLRDFGVAPETGGPDYVAPEQILGGPVDGRADMYALGAVLYQCLTGVAPYLRPDRAAVLAAHVHEGPPRVSERRMDLPRDLDGVIATAMAKNPADRFDSCGAMITAAAAVIGTGGAVPPPPDQASGTRRRRRRWTVVGALVAAVVLIAGGLLVVPRILNRPTSDELARVPAAVRADCAAADADAAVPGAPR
ncbi:MAG: serine/threonine-protein kinase, partial [Pseudonocardia sp.]